MNTQAAPVLLDSRAQHQEVRQELAAAHTLTVDGDYEGALTIFTGLLNRYILPGDREARLHHGRGLVYLQMNNLDAAGEDFSTAIKLDDSLAGSHALLGEIARRRGHYAQASVLYSQALSRKPLGQANWYLARASTYLEQGRVEDASLDMAQLPDSILDSSDGLILQTRLARARKEADQADEILKRAGDLYPNHAGILLLHASLLREWGRYEESLERTGQVLARHSDHVTAQHIRGLCFLKLNRNQEAVEAFTQLISHEPSQPRYYADRSLAFLRLGNNEAALADCNATLKRLPNLPIAHYRRGVIFSRLKKYGPALAGYTQSLKFNPEYAEAWFARAVLQDQFGYHPAALEDYTKALELKPDWDMALCLRGRIYAYLNQWSSAQKDYDRALEISPELGYAWFLKGRLLEEMSAYDEALLHYEKALHFQEEDHARLSRAAVRQKMGDLPGATEDFLKLMEVETVSQTARLRFADLLLKTGEWEKGVEMASGVLNQDPASVDARWLRAQAALEIGEFEVALEDVEWLLEHDKPTTDRCRLKGDVLSRLNRDENAFASYREALTRFQGNPDAWLGMAELEKKTNQAVEALQSYRNVTRLSPDRPEGYMGIASILETRVMDMKIPEGSKEVEIGAGDEDHLERRNRIKEILELYSKAEQRGANSLDLHLNRAEFLLGIGRRDAAIKDLNRCLQIQPDHPQATELLTGAQP